MIQKVSWSALRRRFSTWLGQPPAPRYHWPLIRRWKNWPALAFEPHDIAAQAGARGHYAVELTEKLPLHIKHFHYTTRRHTRGVTWHERLEIFLPLDGQRVSA